MDLPTDSQAAEIVAKAKGQARVALICCGCVAKISLKIEARNIIYLTVVFISISQMVYPTKGLISHSTNFGALFFFFFASGWNLDSKAYSHHTKLFDRCPNGAVRFLPFLFLGHFSFARISGACFVKKFAQNSRTFSHFHLYSYTVKSSATAIACGQRSNHDIIKWMRLRVSLGVS